MKLYDTVRHADAPTHHTPADVTFAGVDLRYPTGTLALAEVDLELSRGEFVAVLGASGCGKSTLLRLAAGLEAPTSGTVEVGPDSTGVIFQSPTLLPWRSVRSNVELSARLRGVTLEERRTRAETAIEAVGLTEFAASLPAELSGGMRMRVSLARALALRPELMLLDEPFGALDDLTRLRMQEELLRLHAAHGFTALFITHSVSEAVFLASRIVVMSPRPGRIHRVVDNPAAFPRTPDFRHEPDFHERVREVSTALNGVS
ncbi:ABC transporter ATP-binding protein [Nocardiopsis nanhaiensis]